MWTDTHRHIKIRPQLRFLLVVTATHPDLASTDLEKTGEFEIS